MSIYDYELLSRAGESVLLADYKGKVLVIVNTATACGFTPQYKDLAALYDKYQQQGLEIIDIPCNQFAGQAPGTDEEIHEFCTLKYGTRFPQMKKSEINGSNELPLYTYLKKQQRFTGFGDSELAGKMDAMLSDMDADYAKKSDIKWNFTKFVVDRKGKVVKRFEPTADMKQIEEYIKELLE